MAYIALLYKAYMIDRKREFLFREKKHAIQIHHGLVPRYTLYDRYRHFCSKIWKSIKYIIYCCYCPCIPKSSAPFRLYFTMKTEGTFSNYLLKSIFGFLGGIILTYILFMFLVFQLNFKLSSATILCSIIGCVLTIGLAFSYRVRCIVLLILPLFFSKRGRQALLAYAFILAITGPAKNTLRNMGILSESLACGQAQLRACVKQIVDIIKKPFYAIRDALKAVIKGAKVVVKKIKDILMSIKRLIFSIVKFIKSGFQWLHSVVTICNKKVGTPFQRCVRVMDSAILDCNAKLGPKFSWLCSVTYVAKTLCYTVKFLDYLCDFLDYINESIIGVVLRKIRGFVRHIKVLFYVRIKFSHSFQFETTHSKTWTEVTQGIVTEIRQRTENFLALFDIISCATSFFFLFLIVKGIHYRYQFLTNDRFDNHFITENLRRIDHYRAKQDKETIFPLNQREKNYYIEESSLRLVPSERVKLSKSVVLLGTAVLKLSTHMVADYSLYWILATIRYYGKYQDSIEAPNDVTLHVEGRGLLSDLFRSVVKAFKPFNFKLELDTVPCLPDPIPPDYDRYIQIASLIGLCWLLAFFEPYGLRLRHSVMCYYHPDRAKERSVWLYNHILRKRIGFLKFARRKLRTQFKTDDTFTNMTCMEFIRAHTNNKCLLYLLGSNKARACLLCGEMERNENRNKFIECVNYSCRGFYCLNCYKDLENICTLCRNPMDYGDLSDISEEIDSSDYDETTANTNRKTKRKLKRNPSNYSNLETSDTDDTEYSYSYQTEKNLKAPIHDLNEQHEHQEFFDLEGQKNPDFASTESFRSSENTVSASKIHPKTNCSHKTSIEVIKNTESNVLVNLNRGIKHDFVSMDIFTSNQPQEFFKKNLSKVNELNDFDDSEKVSAKNSINQSYKYKQEKSFYNNIKETIVTLFHWKNKNYENHFFDESSDYSDSDLSDDFTNKKDIPINFIFTPKNETIESDSSVDSLVAYAQQNVNNETIHEEVKNCNTLKEASTPADVPPLNLKMVNVFSSRVSFKKENEKPPTPQERINENPEKPLNWNSEPRLPTTESRRNIRVSFLNARAAIEAKATQILSRHKADAYFKKIQKPIENESNQNQNDIEIPESLVKSYYSDGYVDYNSDLRGENKKLYLERIKNYYRSLDANYPSVYELSSKKSIWDYVKEKFKFYGQSSLKVLHFQHNQFRNKDTEELSSEDTLSESNAFESFDAQNNNGYGIRKIVSKLSAKICEFMGGQHSVQRLQGGQNPKYESEESIDKYFESDSSISLAEYLPAKKENFTGNLNRNSNTTAPKKLNSVNNHQRPQSEKSVHIKASLSNSYSLQLENNFDQGESVKNRLDPPKASRTLANDLVKERSKQKELVETILEPRLAAPSCSDNNKFLTDNKNELFQPPKNKHQESLIKQIREYFENKAVKDQEFQKLNIKSEVIQPKKSHQNKTKMNDEYKKHNYRDYRESYNDCCHCNCNEMTQNLPYYDCSTHHHPDLYFERASKPRKINKSTLPYQETKPYRKLINELENKFDEKNIFDSNIEGPVRYQQRIVNKSNTKRPCTCCRCHQNENPYTKIQETGQKYENKFQKTRERFETQVEQQKFESPGFNRRFKWEIGPENEWKRNMQGARKRFPKDEATKCDCYYLHRRNANNPCDYHSSDEDNYVQIRNQDYQRDTYHSKRQPAIEKKCMCHNERYNISMPQSEQQIREKCNCRRTKEMNTRRKCYSHLSKEKLGNDWFFNEYDD